MERRASNRERMLLSVNVFLITFISLSMGCTRKHFLCFRRNAAPSCENITMCHPIGCVCEECWLRKYPHLYQGHLYPQGLQPAPVVLPVQPIEAIQTAPPLGWTPDASQVQPPVNWAPEDPNLAALGWVPQNPTEYSQPPVQTEPSQFVATPVVPQ